MNIIKFNDAEFQVNTFNKSTTFNGAEVSSNGYCDLIANDVTVLHDLAHTDITIMQIYHDGTLIYNSENIRARIMNIQEYLNGDHMSVNINFTFNEAQEEEEEEPVEIPEENPVGE